MFESKLAELGIQLHEVEDRGKPYVGFVQTGSYVYLSGHGPDGGGKVWNGKVGVELSIDQGYAAARGCAINLLSTLKTAIGDLSKVKKIVKVLGMVNCNEGFAHQPEVINGCSDLFQQVFAERGRHARSAVGVAGLPRNWPVEIEMIVEIEH